VDYEIGELPVLVELHPQGPEGVPVEHGILLACVADVQDASLSNPL
jgi:hypothetical protein